MYELSNIAKDNSEVFTEIMLHLKPQEFAQVSLVNHNFHELTQTDVLWKLKFKQYFPNDFPTSVPNNFNWKKAFIQQYRNTLSTGGDYLREAIPSEVLFKILGYLTPKSILTEVSPLAHYFTDFSHNALLWQQLFIEHFPEELPFPPSDNYDWLSAFKEKYSAKYKNVKITTLTAIIRNEVETVKTAQLSLDELAANNFLLVKTALKNQSQDCLDHFFELAKAQLQPTSKSSLLHWMVLCNQIGQIKAYSGELNSPTPEGQTALMLAIENDRFQIFEHLLSKDKIELMLKDAKNKSILSYVLTQDDPHRLLSLLKRASAIIAQNHKQQISTQPFDAAQKKREINQQIHKYIIEALFLSIKIEAPKCFDFLLRHPLFRTRGPVIYNRTLIETITYGRVEMLSTLLKLSSSNKITQINALKIYMERAAKHGHYEINKYLHSLLGELLTQNNENQAPLTITGEEKADMPSLVLRGKLLKIAALNGHLAFIQSFLADNVINLTLEEERLAAIEALNQPELWLTDKVNVLKYLISKGLINPTQTPADVLYRAYAAALKRNQNEFCEFLLNHTPINGKTIFSQLYIDAFFQALKTNNITFIKFLLAREFIDINQKIVAQVEAHTNRILLVTTPIHIATQHNHLELVEYLLDNGSNINALDSHEKTAIHSALIFNETKALELLLQRGANPATGRSPIISAIYGNHLEGLTMLLQSTPPELTRSGLITAVTLGATSCTEILLNHGAELDSYIFQLAAESKHLNIVQLFLEKTKMPIHFVDAALLWRCHQNRAVFQLLAQHGISPITCIEQCITQKKSIKEIKLLLELNDQLKLPKIDLNQLLEQAKTAKNHHAIKYLQRELASEHAAKEGGISYQIQQLKEKAEQLGFRNGQKISASKTALDKKIHLARGIIHDPRYQVLNYEQSALIYTTYEDAYRQGHAHGLAKRKQDLVQDENKSIDERATKRSKITPDDLSTVKRKAPETSGEEKTKAQKHRKLEKAPEQIQPAEEELAAGDTANARTNRGTYSPSFFTARVKEEESTDMDAVNEQDPKSPSR